MTRRTHIRSNKDKPPVGSIEARIAALEVAVATLTRSIGNLKVLRDSGEGLPTLPAGSGHALSIARQTAQWSNKQLAEAVGVSSSLLSLWERERQAIPLWRVAAIEKIFTDANATPPAWTKEKA